MLNFEVAKAKSNMEKVDEKQLAAEVSADKDYVSNIPFSRTIKAGKRIYYIDAKQTRNGEYYLSLTESKKVVSGDEENPSVRFEKHKLFLYPEDFDNVIGALSEAVGYIEEHQGKAEPRPELDADIHIDLEF